MKWLKNNILTLLIAFCFVQVNAQSVCDTMPFLRCAQNEILNFEPDFGVINLKQKLERIAQTKSEKINIVHIGDSHLQAAFLSESIKQKLFQYFYTYDTFASPGFIFPYTVAQTNNPFYYKIDYSGSWEWCRNVDKEKICSLGLSGITIRTNNSESSVSIKMQNKKYTYPVKYYFNRIKILHNADTSFYLTVNNKEVVKHNGYSTIMLEHLTDSINIQLNISDTTKYFELYGIILDDDETPVNYHTIGVNGATALSYLKCDYFSEHLKLINPDYIIISLGTNEAYDKNFIGIQHRYEFADLIHQIKGVLPNTLILVTTPNDHLKERSIPNPNTEIVRKNIIGISREQHLFVWDFYDVMGGEGSINYWYEKGLTADDRLHFKKRGYEIQAGLFFDAFLKTLNQINLAEFQNRNQCRLVKANYFPLLERD